MWGCARRTPEPGGNGDPATGPAAGIDGSRLGAPDAEPQNWLTYGRDYGEQRFSPLDQIKAANIGGLVTELHVIVNRIEELERRVPTG